MGGGATGRVPTSSTAPTVPTSNFKSIYIYFSKMFRYFSKIIIRPVAEFKEFERRFKFKPRFKYGWFHLKLYHMFQDLSRRFI